jgi:hypothetical protein
VPGNEPAGRGAEIFVADCMTKKDKKEEGRKARVGAARLKSLKIEADEPNKLRIC